MRPLDLAIPVAWLAALLGATPVVAQVPGAAAAGTRSAPRPAVVVQIAGTTIYLDLGTDAGVATGDTLTVRRAPVGVAGTVVVLAATPTRSVLAFAGSPIPVTRGDTLFVTPGRAPPPGAVRIGGGVASGTVPPATARPSDGARTRYRRIDGALGLEMWGSHSEVIGLGADPVHTTRDLGVPAVRLRAGVADDVSSLDLMMRVEHRTGPESVFDRRTRLRVYGARYERRIGALDVTAGRFFSDFDHASGFWDGVTVQVGDRGGRFAGVAAGFEPLRGNEEFSAQVPKAAVFVGASRVAERSDLSTRLAYHRTFGGDYALQRQAFDWSLYLRRGPWSLSQELEVSPPTLLGTFGISRYILRGGASLGRADLYLSAVSDRPLGLDSVWTPLAGRRERLDGGFGWRAASGLALDLNAALLDPRDSTTGFASGATLSLPGIAGSTIASVTGSYFHLDGARGFIASPALEYRVGTVRIRAAYQLYRVGGAWEMTTHGADLRFSQSLFRRFDWVMQVGSRLGRNVRSTQVLSSLDWRF